MHEIYLNGAFVAPENAMVSVLDRGFLFGDGVYEVIPAYAGRPLRALEHLQRLANSLREIGLEPPLAAAEWLGVFQRLLAAEPEADQALYLQVTRGPAAIRDHRFPASPVPTILAMAKPIKARDPALREQGVAAVIRDDIRWLRCDIKSTALIAAVLLRQSAEEAGAEEAILVRDGLALEGSTSNLFMVRDERLITPPKGSLLLAGITRELVLELAVLAEIAIEERNIALEELRRADEIWISSSTRELMPVTQLDGSPVGDGRPGPWWQRLDALYQDVKARLRSE